VLILTCNEGETLSFGIGEQVCAEDRASIPLQEKGVMGLSGTWCVDRQQVTRQAVVGFVPTVRCFLEIDSALRRVHRHLELAPIAPGRPLMARSGQTDGLNRTELFEVFFGYRQGINEDGLAFFDDRVAVALGFDPVVVHGETIDAGEDLARKLGRPGWFRHVVSISLGPPRPAGSSRSYSLLFYTCRWYGR